MGNKKYIILFVLCLGYFIDFYDLSIFSVSYVQILKEQFGIVKSVDIQQTYYLINSIQTVGILIGALLFGKLADKFGRIAVIKYSILLYSISTLSAIFVTNLNLFIIFRFLAYVGLASEFAVSTVLIIEFFPKKIASWGMSILYILGVLGGVFALFVDLFSWKMMFIFGGLAGLLIFVVRNKLEESPIFLNAYKNNTNKKNNGSFIFLIKNYYKPLIANFILSLPYYFLIIVMFSMVQFLVKDQSFGVDVKTMLLGFFLGNIFTCILSGIYNQFFTNIKPFMILSLIVYFVSITSYSFISESNLLLFGIAIGFVGGGYSITLYQNASAEFPTEIRALSSNAIFALGRLSSILFSILVSHWITNESLFNKNLYIYSTVLFALALIVTIFYKRENLLKNNLK